MMTVDEAIAKAEQWRKENACGEAEKVAIALLDELEIARALLSKAIPEWKTADVPPTAWGSYLCWSKHDGFNIYWWQLKDGGTDGRKAGNWYGFTTDDFNDYSMNHNVSHWMPLPAAPSVEGGGA